MDNESNRETATAYAVGITFSAWRISICMHGRTLDNGGRQLRMQHPNVRKIKEPENKQNYEIIPESRVRNNSKEQGEKRLATEIIMPHVKMA